MLFGTTTNSDVEVLTAERLRLAASVRAPRTIAGYASDWKDFETWAAPRGLDTLPASTETVALYVTELLGKPRRVSTVSRHVTSINNRHRDNGHAAPGGKDVTALLIGAQRIRGEQPQQKAPIGIDQLRAIVAAINGESHIAVRNRAMLLLGFATALRRSNIVALTLEDVAFVDQGIAVRVRREKQDQRAKGRSIGVPHGKSQATCPVIAVRAWLDRRGTAAGPIFTEIRNGRCTVKGLHPNLVAKTVKTAIRAIGLDPASYSGHSLRAGFVTAAFEARVPDIVIAAQTGHRSLSCLRRYFRPADPFRANACSALGL